MSDPNHDRHSSGDYCRWKLNGTADTYGFPSVGYRVVEEYCWMNISSPAEDEYKTTQTIVEATSAHTFVKTLAVNLILQNDDSLLITPSQGPLLKGNNWLLAVFNNPLKFEIISHDLDLSFIVGHLGFQQSLLPSMTLYPFLRIFLHSSSIDFYYQNVRNVFDTICQLEMKTSLKAVHAFLRPAVAQDLWRSNRDMKFTLEDFDNAFLGNRTAHNVFAPLNYFFDHRCAYLKTKYSWLQ
jgi:hypothetical protein